MSQVRPIIPVGKQAGAGRKVNRLGYAKQLSPRSGLIGRASTYEDYCITSQTNSALRIYMK